MRRQITMPVREALYDLARYEFIDSFDGIQLDDDDPREQATFYRSFMRLLDDIGWDADAKPDGITFALTMSDDELRDLCLAIVSRSERLLCSYAYDEIKGSGIVESGWTKPVRWLNAAMIVLEAGPPGDRGERVRAVDLPLTDAEVDQMRRRLLDDGQVDEAPRAVLRQVLDDYERGIYSAEKAAEVAGTVLSKVPYRSALHAELERMVNDRLGVARNEIDPETLISLRHERAYLAACLAAGADLGRVYLARVTEEHFPNEAVMRARDHLLEHFDDPASTLSGDEPPAVGAFILAIVADAAERPTPSEAELRVTFLSTDLHRIERELDAAGSVGDTVALARLSREKRNAIEESVSATGAQAGAES